MVFQSIEEIQAQLLIDPKTHIFGSQLGKSLFFIHLNTNWDQPITCMRDNLFKYILLNNNLCVIELKSAEDILTLLEDENYYFDFNKTNKVFSNARARA